ncbi:MAG: hypothetical protein ACKO37_02745 [Vampirovibrionales bacterium]
MTFTPISVPHAQGTPPIQSLNAMTQHCLGLKHALEAVCDCLAAHHQALTHEKLEALESLGKELSQHYLTLQKTWLKPLEKTLKANPHLSNPEGEGTLTSGLSAWLHHQGRLENNTALAQHLIEEELPILQALLRKMHQYTEQQQYLAKVSLRWTQQAIEALTKEATPDWEIPAYPQGYASHHAPTPTPWHTAPHSSSAMAGSHPSSELLKRGTQKHYPQEIPTPPAGKRIDTSL